MGATALPAGGRGAEIPPWTSSSALDRTFWCVYFHCLTWTGSDNTTHWLFSDEANVPAKYQQAQEDPRLSPPDGHQGWPAGTCTPPCPGPGSAIGIDLSAGRVMATNKGEPEFGFPKRVRLCHRLEIDRVFREGTYRRLGTLHSKILATDRSEPRFLISVKKKIGKAHTRNRIKRLVREAIRHQRRQLEGAYDICLFMTHPPREPLQLANIEAEIRNLIGHLNQSPN